MFALLNRLPKFVSPNAALPWSGFCQFGPTADVRGLVEHAAHGPGQATVVVDAFGLRVMERGERDDRGQGRGQRGRRAPLRAQQIQGVPLAGGEGERVEHGAALRRAVALARQDPFDHVGVGEERDHGLQ